jgi:hypothetical protein
MKKYRAVYIFIAVLTVIGSGLVLADAYQSVVADDFRAAVEYADTSNSHCYQLYPGVISSVRVTQVSTGQRDEVNIASPNRTVRVSLLPSASQAALVQVGEAVSVEWYVGSVASVLIAGHAVPSISNPFIREDFGYVGWLMIWVAAFFGVVMLITRKLAKAPASPWITAITDRAFGITGSEVLLPGGTTGWSVRPRLKPVVVLPFVFAIVALVSIRPFMNPERRPIAYIADLLLLGSVMVGLALVILNDRVMADTTQLMAADRLGRIQRWPLRDVERVASFNTQGPFSSVIRSLRFEGRGGAELFTVTSMFWDVDEVEAMCLRFGLHVYPTGGSPRNWRLRVAIFAFSLVIMAVMAWALYPLPP